VVVRNTGAVPVVRIRRRAGRRVGLAFGGERSRSAMPKAKPAIQWALVLFAVFWIVHDPRTTTNMVGDVFTFISNFFHSIGNIVSFHTNT
jgi:hypothetical protein